MSLARAETFFLPAPKHFSGPRRNISLTRAETFSDIAGVRHVNDGTSLEKFAAFSNGELYHPGSGVYDHDVTWCKMHTVRLLKRVWIMFDVVQKLPSTRLIKLLNRPTYYLLGMFRREYVKCSQTRTFRTTVLHWLRH